MDALSVLAQPCRNIPEVLETLKGMGVDFSIATTSGKPRVPVSAGKHLFTRPKVKPKPQVICFISLTTQWLTALKYAGTSTRGSS